LRSPIDPRKMIYLLFVFFLLAVGGWDYFSVDAWRARRQKV
jgi:hypothetical protein